MNRIAEIIVDISHESVDRAFEYIIPESLSGAVKVGSRVNIPFGRSDNLIKGFVTALKTEAAYDESKLKAVDSVDENTTDIEGSMIELAAFIKENYGSTMNQALKIVLPAKNRSKPVIQRFVSLNVSEEEARNAIQRFSEGRKSTAKIRLLTELVKEDTIILSIVRDKLNISASTLRALEKEGLIKIDVKENLRDVINIKTKKEYSIRLNEYQNKIVADIWSRYEKDDKRPSLIRGVTGSGKTEIYIELIDRMIKQGRQAIVLIPEIALTYQTVIRFYNKFGDRISVLNSKLSPAQKYDQMEKARRGEVDIIIGPRSALFVPFKDPGIIIIDEEHEGTYKNENVPRYHSREVAIKRAGMAGGIVVMGSATPSVESYDKALKNEYCLYELLERAKGAQLPDVEVVDLRSELAKGNRSIVSERLDELIKDRLEKKEQIMLFLNRRGYSSFVSCRNCGEAIKCPHCDVSLKYHRNNKLICHYCGFETPMVKECPKCGSKYIGTFGTGTQKVEEELNKLYPGAKILRMDRDTTKNKDGHEKILSAFANNEADILVGTQMIVKGHDFENVSLVGILAADMSLYSGDYLAAERTFELLTQAAGRAGRGERHGNVVIQTYSPDNYAIECGASQDYKKFYDTEIGYRKILGYPPEMNMMAIRFSARDVKKLDTAVRYYSDIIDDDLKEGLIKLGPTDEPIAKINDVYRKVIYLKSKEYNELTEIKNIVEKIYYESEEKNIYISFDFSLKS